MSKRRAAKSTISLRQRAAIVLAQLYRVAEVQRANGEIPASGPWLKVLANVLSSMPAGYDGDRRGRNAPAFFGLSVATLMQAAKRSGLHVTIEDIETQVADSGEWRAQLSKQRGIVRFAIMRADKIGALLGVTDEIRAEAKAWNIGTYDGSKSARDRARKERHRMRDESRRRAAGARPHSHSLSRLKPWEAEGISRRTWYRRRDDGGTNSCATNRGPGGGTNSCGTNSCATNKERGTNSCATNIHIKLRSHECANAPEPSTSQAFLAYQEKEASIFAPRDDEWLVSRGPSGGIIVADVIPMEGFPPIGRKIARVPAAGCRDRADILELI